MPRPTRRKTKSVTACETCYERKTRCELVTELGCHRCQVLRITCSLRPDRGSLEGIISARNATVTAGTRLGLTTTSSNLTEAQVLADLRDRVIQMQTQLNDLSRQGSASRRDSRTTSGIPIDPAASAEQSSALEIDLELDASTPMAGLQRVGAAVSLERCTVSGLINEALGITFDARMKGPVSSGILSEVEYHRVWQR